MTRKTSGMRLLRTFGVSEALAGDLLEQRQRGRSALWYWRQVLVALAVAITRDFRAHKVLAFRALLLGLVSICVTNALTDWLFRSTAPFLRTLAAASGLSALNVWWLGYKIPFLILGWVAAGIAGWIVARSSRPYSAPVLVVFTLALVFLFAPWASWVMGHRDAWMINAVHIFLVVPTSVMLGGSVGAAPKRCHAPR